MYSINHSLLYVLFSMYILISLGKSTMVPSISPVPVLLKCKVVWGSPPPNMTLLILNYCLWAADKKKLQYLQKEKKKRFFRCISFSILFYYLRWFCCEFCTFLLYRVCSGSCRDYRCLVFHLLQKWFRCSSLELFTKGT